MAGNLARCPGSLTRPWSRQNTDSRRRACAIKFALTQSKAVPEGQLVAVWPRPVFSVEDGTEVVLT